MIEQTLFLGGKVKLYPGDCIGVMQKMPENSVDSIVVDPPYHLTSIVKRFGSENAAPPKDYGPGNGLAAYARASAGFMGKQWDGGDIAFRVETWKAVLRVLKPGGYLLAFASTRGFGRMSVAIEDAGFVTHPLTAFLTEHADAQDFLSMLTKPQLDAFLRLLEHNDLGGMLGWIFGSGFPKATRIKAEGYDGFRYGGQALKPAIEPIYMGQKPFSEATGTANILKHGTGALNIDGTRIGTRIGTRTESTGEVVSENVAMSGANYGRLVVGETIGRWPANVIHDGSEEVISAFPETDGSVQRTGKRTGVLGEFSGQDQVTMGHDDDGGSAARFFYSSKADADDRIGSKHPTVKPIDLMRYLVRLVTPPGGTVLDPFAGTGTTGEAAYREGMRAILIEREPEYQADIAERMRLILSGPDEKRREIIKRKGMTAEDAGPLFGGAA